ncbi:hypothetical protein ABZV24_19620 [Streptomyces sp. NPDC005251]
MHHPGRTGWLIALRLLTSLDGETHGKALKISFIMPWCHEGW